MATYYFIGIKGSGMSALAQVLFDRGDQVLGSDIDQYTFTQAPLENRQIQILSFDPANLKDGYIVVRGNAFEADIQADANHEVKAAYAEIEQAKAMGLQILTYPEVLESIIDSHTSIGVAGAHGKTSTTGLLSHTMSQIVPTSYLIGDGTGKGLPNSDFFVFEADEYRRHFQSYTPDYAVMTNIDFDHPDYFSGIDDVYQAFEDFGKHVKKGVVAWGEDEQLRRLSIDAPVCYYGTEATDDFRAIDIQRFTTGSTFKVTYQEEVIGEFSVPLFGRHGVLNALAVVAIAQLEGLDMQAVKEALETFAGVKRRFSEKHINDVTIIDDYAHHPSEITATLDAARQRYPGREIVAVFQPHTYSRTIAYLDEFAKSLSLADRVYLTDIFGSAREEEGAVSSADLGALINTFGGIVKKHDMSLLLDHSDAVLVFMGAGDISEYEVNYEELLTNTKNSLQ